MALTSKQRRFIDAYFKTWNATQAALDAGYAKKSAHTIGWENLQKPAIQEEIKARLDKSAMSADEVLKELAEIAQADLSYVIDINDSGYFSINLSKAKKMGKLGMIKSITPTANGIKIELHDKMRALELLGKHHQLFTDRIDVTAHGEGLLDSNGINLALLTLAEAIGEIVPGEASETEGDVGSAEPPPVESDTDEGG
jgi:phage terminase small subunit